MADENEVEESSSSSTTTVIRKPVDLQRMKLEKLMKNPEKPAFIPDILKDKRFPEPPEFVRNVMGSSAGAGSGEFHVYRHIRRREYARNLYLQKSKEKNVLDEEFHQKLEQNKKEAENKTAKKRAKRQKLKMKKRQKKTSKTKKESDSDKNDSEHSDNKSEDNSDSKNDSDENEISDR